MNFKRLKSDFFFILEETFPSRVCFFFSILFFLFVLSFFSFFFLFFFLFSLLLVFICRNRESSGYIVKYNLQTERVETTIYVSGYTGRKYSYDWGGYSGMDLAVDEQGLWVLFGSTVNSGRLTASKIDVYKNVVTRTWNLNTG